MVFEPALVKIEPGDTVKFVATDKGHNAETIKGMLPDGAAPFAGKINEDIAVTFDKAGVYGVQVHAALRHGHGRRWSWSASPPTWIRPRPSRIPARRSRCSPRCSTSSRRPRRPPSDAACEAACRGATGAVATGKADCSDPRAPIRVPRSSPTASGRSSCFGALYAGLAILAWLPVFYGELELSTAFAPRDWHVHEMLYGYLPAVITGFLLTAIPNWTGRLPLQGRAADRARRWLDRGPHRGDHSRLRSAGWPRRVIDARFLLLVAAAAAREIIAGSNWRNLKVVSRSCVLAVGNIVFHVEAHVARRRRLRHPHRHRRRGDADHR